MGSRLLALVLTLGLVAAGCSGTTPGQKDPDRTTAPSTGGDEVAPREPEPDPIVDAQSHDILKAMAKTLREAKLFTVEAQTTVEELISTGHTIELETTVKGTIRRPDGVFVEKTTERHQRRLYYDGKRIALLDVGKNLYATRDWTGSLGELIDGLEKRFGVSMPLGDLIVMDADMALSEFADWGIYLGIHRVRGRRCHHMVFANEFLEWQLWVQAEGDSLPRKLVIIYKDEPGRPTFSATITKWDLAAEVADEAFTFTPPEGALQIDLAERSVDEESEEVEVIEEEGR